MDDNISMKSSDSVTTSGEYEIVPELIDCGEELGRMRLKPNNQSPTLAIANNGDMAELAKNMDEVMHDIDGSAGKSSTLMESSASDADDIPIFRREVGERPVGVVVMDTAAAPSVAGQAVASTSADYDALAPVNRVGQSVFYDCLDLSPTGEKQDTMKAERSEEDETEEEMSEIDQDCTIFAGVTYLGAATINAPKSMIEVLRNMAELNGISEASAVGLKVSVSIPTCSEGLVVLSDASTNAVIAHYEVKRILFYARGPVGSPEQACFAFTWSHGDSQESAVFQCHIFKCLIPEAVAQVSSCFSKAFERIPASLTGSVISPAENSVMMSSITSDITGNPISSAQYEFIVALEIREKVSKNSYSSVPRDQSSFRLRCNTDKEISISVKQSPSTKLAPLFIERCFGVLLSPGKLVRQADMQLLDMVTMGYNKSDSPQTAGGSTTSLSSTTTGNAQSNAGLNPYMIRAEWKSNDKNFERLNTETQKMYITVAVDLVIKGIQEPVRFVIETPVTIQGYSDFLFRKYLSTGGKKTMLQRFYLQLKDSGDGGWEVNSIDPSDEIVEQSGQNSIMKNLGTLSKMVRSSSTVSTPFDDEIPSDESSGGDEPLLSGTGEVSKDCSQDTLDEWGPVLQEWDGEKRPKNLAHLVRLSVPEALRGKVWQRLANMENKTEFTDMYRVLLTKETKCEEVIQRDIHRTFPAHKFFRETGGIGQDSLFKVSKAYAVYDKEVGYCQGLSFVAATLLLHMPEEEAFCVLVSLMYQYGLRDLYKDGFENLYLRLYQLNSLMKDQLPKLYEHFERIGIETHMFASQWFLTLFTARFPLYFVFHILDVFLLEGMSILFQVALTLLAVCEQELRQLDFEGVLKFVRVSLPKKCRSPAQARKMMKSACDRKVKKLRQYEEEFITNKETTEKHEAAAKQFDQKFNEERQKLRAETIVLQSKFDAFVEKQRHDSQKTATILLDYKQIIQRQELQITESNRVMEELQQATASCKSCSANLSRMDSSSTNKRPTSHLSTSQNEVDAPLGPLDPLNVALQRVRELELELAQTKLAHVEAECKNQDLNHQLNSALTEIQSTRNSSWQPWISKTINSFQEKVATRRDTPSFQTYTGTHPIGDGVIIHTGANVTPLQDHNRDRESPKLARTKLHSTASLSRMDIAKHEAAILSPHSTRNSVN